MKTARLFQHGGSQAVRLPKAFRFEGTEVRIEKRNSEVILKPVPKPKFKTFADIGKYLAEKFPEADAEEFPGPPPRPKTHERPILEF